MKHLPHLSAVDWVKRINRSWIVHNNLNDQADEWVSYLSEMADGRLESSCRLARSMCDAREPLDDPKPWFYAGLFHFATSEEALRFIEFHRVTKATVPTMSGDETVHLWLDRISPETRKLVSRMQQALATPMGGQAS